MHLLSQVPDDHVQHFEVRLRQFVDQFVHFVDALVKTLLFCVGYGIESKRLVKILAISQ